MEYTRSCDIPKQLQNPETKTRLQNGDLLSSRDGSLLSSYSETNPETPTPRRAAPEAAIPRASSRKSRCRDLATKSRCGGLRQKPRKRNLPPVSQYSGRHSSESRYRLKARSEVKNPSIPAKKREKGGRKEPGKQRKLGMRKSGRMHRKYCQLSIYKNQNFDNNHPKIATQRPVAIPWPILKVAMPSPEGATLKSTFEVATLRPLPKTPTARPTPEKATPQTAPNPAAPGIGISDRKSWSQRKHTGNDTGNGSRAGRNTLGVEEPRKDREILYRYWD
jgi:hypothetical protein